MFARRRNPLTRGSDRFEFAMLLTLFVSFLLGAPISAWWVAGVSYRTEQRALEWEQRNVYRVDAVLSGPADPASPFGTSAPRQSAAAWTAPNGTPRTGTVLAAPGQQPGERVRIWVNAAGDQRAEPPKRNPVGRATIIAIVVIAGVAALLNGLRRLGVALLARYRARAWQREWREVGPRWSRDLLP